jgi:hypothetical protein
MKAHRIDNPNVAISHDDPWAYRIAPGLYVLGPVAISRECHNLSCDCDRYWVRLRLDDYAGGELGDSLAEFQTLDVAAEFAYAHLAIHGTTEQRGLYAR